MSIRFTESNQRYISLEIGRIQRALEYYVNNRSQKYQWNDNDVQFEQELKHVKAGMTSPTHLETICATFGLSPFEKDILLLCAGAELDSSIITLLEIARGANRKPLPSFGLALSALSGEHWSAFTPSSPLRFWRLIELGNTDGLTSSDLKIDESILHYIVGLDYFDERLQGYTHPVYSSGTLAPSHDRLVRQAVKAYTHSPGLKLIELNGTDRQSQMDVASGISREIGANLKYIKAQAIPRETSEAEALARLCDRQSALTQSILLLDCSDIDEADRTADSAISQFISVVQSTLILTRRVKQLVYGQTAVSFDVAGPTVKEQADIWRQMALTDNTDSEIESIVSQFNLNTTTIETIAGELRLNAHSCGKGSNSSVLWDLCRKQTRPRMDEMARYISSKAVWDDLVLPEAPRQTLQEISGQVRQKMKVYEEWGFGSRLSRGLGITALLIGPSGTGKTMAAEILSNELRLDLYRIDLSQVISKYIGETEKNLRKVFDAAEDGGAILLFDEADALFGKRSEVKDSHDRYANVEISYLLQRMEDYRGLAILTTNNKEAIDTAFMRRLRFVVQFPFPGIEQRRDIWRRIFPSETPTEDLDLDKLARLNVAGGNIRNIALYAAFLAAEVGEPVKMSHLLRASRVEYAKLERSLTDSEIRGWV